MSLYKSTKTFGHELGLSCCFRQWRAQSHCNLVHGYALSFKFTFASRELDFRNWVVDFGGLTVLKEHLRSMFDHTLLVARDDPQQEELAALERLGLARVIFVDAVGCEATAKLAFDLGNSWLRRYYTEGRVWIESVEVAEHGANSAIYQNNEPHV